MKLLTNAQENHMIKNGSPIERSKDHIPVVKLFTPWSNITWLLTELDPEEPTRAFGLVDLGFGFPELGYVDLDEIANTPGPFGLKVERDLHFQAKYPLSVYRDAAHVNRRIVERDDVLALYVKRKPPGPQPS
jgi:hypothetical protein